MKNFFVKYKITSILLSVLSLIGGTGYVGTLVIQDMPIYKSIDKAYVTSMKVDSIQKVNKIRMDYMYDYISRQVKNKSEEYQVGLRFKKLNGKLYFRDMLKEYREIKHDVTGDYYRDANDKRVYINDKLN